MENAQQGRGQHAEGFVISGETAGHWRDFLRCGRDGKRYRCGENAAVGGGEGTRPRLHPVPWGHENTCVIAVPQPDCPDGRPRKWKTATVCGSSGRKTATRECDGRTGTTGNAPCRCGFDHVFRATWQVSRGVCPRYSVQCSTSEGNRDNWLCRCTFFQLILWCSMPIFLCAQTAWKTASAASAERWRYQAYDRRIDPLLCLHVQ